MLPRSYAVRLLGAVLAGVSLWLALPDHNLWWLAPVGVALLGVVTLDAGWGRGFGLGLVAGMAYFTPALSWSGIYVGALPWFALATLQALYIAATSAVVGGVGGALIAHGRRGLSMAVVPLAWVVGEWARSTTPFGGFPWARIALSQADSPLLPYAAYAGAPGVTLAVAVLGISLAHAAYRIASRQWRASTWPLAVAAAVLAVPGTFALPTDGREVTVGYVQGNVPRPGLDFNAERRAVLDNHVVGTERLAGSAPDDLTLVAWPENSSDIDPFRNADAAAAIRRALDTVRVPILVGAVTEIDEQRVSNASLLYQPGTEAPARYDKLHPVPFAEYIPYRDFFRLFSDKVDLVTRDFVAGSEVGVFTVPAATGDYQAIPTICFEVAYDGLMRDAVLAADQESLLVVQTNNATFGFTAESTQQLAISRLRAVEHGRAIIHVSTVGVSGFIAPDGSVSERSELFTAHTAVTRLPVRTGLTVSDRIGALPEWLALGLLLLLGGVSVRRRTPSRVLAPAPQHQDHTLV